MPTVTRRLLPLCDSLLPLRVVVLTFATRLMSLAASRLMLWPSILAAVGRFPRQNCRFHLRGGDGNVLGLDGGALTVLALALLCWVEPMLTRR